MKLENWKRSVPALTLALSLALTSSGCAVALVAGGVAGGYVAAKHIEEDKKLREKKKEQEGNKGWLSKFTKNEDES